MSDLQTRQSGEVGPLLDDLKTLIEQARQQVAVAVNTGLTLLYWQVGQRIRSDLLQKEDRAVYGKRILATLSPELTQRYGKGFALSALSRMVKFAEVFPEIKIVATLSQQLSWSHFLLLLPLDKPMQRDFYAEMCRIERWSVRTLSARIDSMLYQRTALSRQPDALIQHELAALRETDHITPALVFRDPYFLDFLGLDDHYIERDVEDAIMRELEQFLLELGGGFSFIARQKRIPVGGDDYFLDLLFYNTHLHSHVVIDLKIDEFKPEYVGKMQFYLAAVDDQVKTGQDGPSIGLILCKTKNGIVAEYALRDTTKPIGVAEYRFAPPGTERSLPSIKQLETELSEALKEEDGNDGGGNIGIKPPARLKPPGRG